MDNIPLKIFMRIFKKIKISLQYITDSLLLFFFTNSSNLSRKEKELTKELRRDFKKLSYLHNESSEGHWLNTMNSLYELVFNKNPSKFLRWNVIKQNMFIGNVSYISTELNFLLKLQDWVFRWRKAIEESPVGCPTLYWKYPRSSGNLIHQAYHLSQFEMKTKVKVSDMNIIFEFGGGYGSMCRLCYNLNFTGKYIIFDFPYFSSLQKFYLKLVGIKILSLDSFNKEKNGVLCISDFRMLRKILLTYIKNENFLFISTWGLSEAPVILREKILKIADNFEYFLLTYQRQFEGINNINYFEKWKNKINNSGKFYNWEIVHIPNNYYLIRVKIMS